METYAKHINFGSLYSFPKNNIVVIEYNDPTDKRGNGNTKTIWYRTPFVPLEIVKENKKTGMIRIKTLLTDGTIWYMNMYPNDIRLMKEITSCNE